jgi:hypothetical protein
VIGAAQISTNTPISLCIPFSAPRRIVHSFSRPRIPECKIEATPGTLYAYEFFLISAPQPSLSSALTEFATTSRADLLPPPHLLSNPQELVSSRCSTSKPTCCSRRTKGSMSTSALASIVLHPPSIISIAYSSPCSHTVGSSGKLCRLADCDAALASKVLGGSRCFARRGLRGCCRCLVLTAHYFSIWKYQMSSIYPLRKPNSWASSSPKDSL